MQGEWRREYGTFSIGVYMGIAQASTTPPEATVSIPMCVYVCFLHALLHSWDGRFQTQWFRVLSWTSLGLRLRFSALRRLFSTFPFWSDPEPPGTTKKKKVRDLVPSYNLVQAFRIRDQCSEIYVRAWVGDSWETLNISALPIPYPCATNCKPAACTQAPKPIKLMSLTAVVADTKICWRVWPLDFSCLVENPKLEEQQSQNHWGTYRG